MSREVTGSLLPHLLPEGEGWDDFSRVAAGDRVPRAVVERSSKRAVLLRRLPEEGKEEKRPLFLTVAVCFSLQSFLPHLIVHGFSFAGEASVG